MKNGKIGLSKDYKQSWLSRTNEFILFDPKALQILLIMSHLMGFVMALVFFVISMVLRADAVIKTVFFLMVLMMGYKLLAFWQVRKQRLALVGEMTVMDFLKNMKVVK